MTELNELDLDSLYSRDRSEINKLISIVDRAKLVRSRKDLDACNQQARNGFKWLFYRVTRERAHRVFLRVKTKEPQTIFSVGLREQLFDHVAFKDFGWERVDGPDQCLEIVRRLVPDLAKDSSARANIRDAELTYLR
jgi:hypothetical protein